LRKKSLGEEIGSFGAELEERKEEEI